MLAQLSTLKSRLAITVSDYDTILTSALTATSVRSDNECNRTLARTVSGLETARPKPPALMARSCYSTNLSSVLCEGVESSLPS